jgi:Ca-activated chloride channel homolog
MRPPNLRHHTKAPILILIALTLSSILVAQEPSPPPAKPAGPPVELSLIVTNSAKKSVDSIAKEDVRISEDKVEQTVLSVERDERPVDCVLAIDSTGSVRSMIPTVMESARLVIVNRRPDDEILVERFVSSEKIQSVQDFTRDEKALLVALDKFYVERGQSAVIDALYVAASTFAKFNKTSKDRRRVIVIISDGEDRRSFYKLDALIKMLRQTGVQVFALGLVIELDKQPFFVGKNPREKAEKLLETVTSETGGRVFFPENKSELFDSIQQIITDLRGQFRLRYQATNTEKKGFRKVEVKLISAAGEKRTAIVPRGYESKF